MLQDNMDGVQKCKDFLILKQLAAGDYMPILEALDLHQCLKDRWGKRVNLTIHVAEAVPEWAMLSLDLVKIVLSNAMHNASEHGKKGGPITLSVEVVGTGNRLMFRLENEAGPKHNAALHLQGVHGKNMLMRGDGSPAIDMSSIRSEMSTFLGVKEMKDAANAMVAETNLTFHPDTEEVAAHVVFSLECELVLGTKPVPRADAETGTLREDVVLICADDDPVPRLQCKGLAKKLNAQKNLMVLGKTYAEIAGLAETVLRVAEQHGDENVVCIFDQNMDNYKEGEALGTDVIRAVRAAGFVGLMFIRSANDDPESARFYRRAGANGVLSKTATVQDVANDLVAKGNLAKALAPWPTCKLTPKSRHASSSPPIAAPEASS
jgi:DNA-binding NarL/FixJ family response regulator